MKTLQIILCFLSTYSVIGQTNIQGSITDNMKEVMIGANVYIKDCFDGTTTDTLGNYSFTTTKQGLQTIVVSYLGYETYMQNIELGGEKSILLNIVMQQSNAQLDAVIVSAGTFEASDSKKSVSLKPIDVVTVASSVGDLVGALATLPGTQRTGSDGYLIVRGGDNTETRTFIDGSCVEKPYTSHTPDLPSRGRFSPMIFKGTMFSTGGFSAQYGQALSSILELETLGLAEKNQASLSVMSVGVGASLSLKTDRFSITSEGKYTNMSPYYLLSGTNVAWTDMPSTLSNLTTARIKTGKNGMLKTMIQISKNGSGMLYPNLDSGNNDSLSLENANIYVNNSYQTSAGQNTVVGINSGFMYDDDALQIGSIALQTNITAFSARLWAKSVVNKTNIRYGIETTQKAYTQNYENIQDTLNATMQFSQPIYATYLEFENTLAKRIMVRHGYRYEYSKINNENTISPRISVAYKINALSQLSFAWGIFRQLQADDYMKFNNSLPSSQALQYIVNYQIKKNDRLLRTEVYYKSYAKLIQYTQLNNPDPNLYSSTGRGDAYGIDVFYKDAKTIKNADFWISYSYIKTQRKYKDYTEFVQPDYVSPHSVNVVYKHFVPKLKTQFGLSYTFASGKMYNNPNQNEYMSLKLNSTNDLSLSLSYLTTVFKKAVIVHASVSNILGIENIYGYRFATEPNKEGVYASKPITPVAKRMYFIGIFITL